MYYGNWRFTTLNTNRTQQYFIMGVFLENLCNILFLVDIDGDYFSIETFTGHLTYWISYSHNTVELCDEHPTQAVVTTPIEIELQPVFYGKSI